MTTDTNANLATTMQVVYRWPDGHEEIRYERPVGSYGALRLVSEVEELHAKAKAGGYESPYSIRFV